MHDYSEPYKTVQTVCLVLSKPTGPKRTIHDHKRPHNEYRTIQNCTIQYRTVQDYTWPYKTNDGHTGPCKAIQDRTRLNKTIKDLTIQWTTTLDLSRTMPDHTGVCESVKFTSIELPSQLKKKHNLRGEFMIKINKIEWLRL